MGIFYSKLCVEEQNHSPGHDELTPIIYLAAAAINPPWLATTYNIDKYTYIELLVTCPNSRGRGVATAIVSEIQSNYRVFQKRFLMRCLIF